MSVIDVDSYIRNRLDDQTNWYEKKAAFNKFRYRLFQIIIIISSASIPLINLISSAYPEDMKDSALVTSAILGSIITIVTSFLGMEKYYETWILYRATVESLKREKVFYQNNASSYYNLSKEEKDRVLVERIELLLSSENSKFLAIQQQQQKQPEKPQ